MMKKLIQNLLTNYFIRVFAVLMLFFPKINHAQNLSGKSKIQLEKIIRHDSTEEETILSAIKILVQVEENDSTKLNYYKYLGNFHRKNSEFNLYKAYIDSALLYATSKNKEIELTENLAQAFQLLGKIDKSLKEYFAILSYYEDTENYKESSRINAAIGVIFKKLNEEENSIYHLNESITQARKINDEIQIAKSLMTLGNCYKAKQDYIKAEEVYLESIEICQRLDLKRYLSGNYNNLGSCLRLTKRIDEAMNYYKKAVIINKEMNNIRWLSYNYNNIGNIYDAKKNYSEAIKYYLLSLEIKEDLNDERGKAGTLISISETYEQMGAFDKACDLKNQYISLNDSLNKIARAQETTKIAAEFQTEKREAEIAQLSIKDELNQAKIKADQDRIFMLGTGIFLLLLMIFLIWKSLLTRKKTNQELEQKNKQIHIKNNELDLKNQEITSSINYAKRFQTSILASHKDLDDFFIANDILYLPKDIVSGDFYMFQKTKTGEGIFTVADCTGHGVPGAMVSLIGSSFFNKAINEENIYSPAGILNYINKEMPKSFESDEVLINDGMDLGVCHINNNKNQLTFSGANNNCWILNHTESFTHRSGRESRDRIYSKGDISILELRGNRTGIGVSSSAAIFDDVKIELHKGDRIVLTTDGYVDQFGGENDKKFKNSNLRSLLINNQNLSAKELTELLKRTIIEWSGESDQIDDICIMIVDF